MNKLFINFVQFFYELEAISDNVIFFLIQQLAKIIRLLNFCIMEMLLQNIESVFRILRQHVYACIVYIHMYIGVHCFYKSVSFRFACSETPQEVAINFSSRFCGFNP